MSGAAFPYRVARRFVADGDEFLPGADVHANDFDEKRLRRLLDAGHIERKPPEKQAAGGEIDSE